MHNLPALSGGTNLCTLQVHPEDAARFGLADGATALIKGDGGEIEAPVEVTDAIKPGVVSLPHGWGHDQAGTRMAVANEHPGVNTNVLSPGGFVDVLSGNAAVNGIPVSISPG